MPQLDEAKPRVLLTMTRNAAANLMRSGTMWIIVMFLPPLLVRVLDKPTYGVWLLLLQMAAYVGVFDGGVQIAVARYVARAEALADRAYLAQLLSSVGMLLVAAAIATMLLSALTSWQLPNLFHAIPMPIARSARPALFVVGMSMACMLPFSVIAGFFLGLQKNQVTAFASSAGRILGAVGVAWEAWHHRGLLNMAVALALGNVAQVLFYLVFWGREAKREPLQVAHVDRAIVRDFLFFCSALAISQFSWILISGMDLPIVAAFDFRAVAYYGVAAMLSNALNVPHGALVNTLMPVAAEISTAGDPQRMGSVLLKSTRVGSALLCLLTLPLLLLMPLLLRLWVGHDYAIHALVFAQILVLAQLVRLTLLPYAMITFAAGQQQRTLASPLVEGALNLLCSLALVRFIGARGVALGTLIGAVAGVALHFAVSLPRTDCVQVSRRRLFGEGIVRPLAWAVPILLAATLVLRRWPSPLLSLLIAGAAELLLLALFWRFSFDHEMRRQIRGVLGHIVNLRARLLPAARA
jgi:O-antigen/teichoic acid export membrane protein